MQLKHTLSYFTIATATSLLAQPTIELANNQPVPSIQGYQEFVIQTSSNWAFEGPSGENASFGLWSLISTGERNYRVYDASVSSSSGLIPGAEMLSTDGGSDTLFWEYSDDGMRLVGSRTSVEGFISYSDPVLELRYPCTYGTTWSDVVAANYTSPLGPATRAGTVTGVADAYGTVEVSEASIPNCLRVKVRRAFTDITAIGTIQRNSTTWYYYSETYPWPVVKLVTDSVVINNGAPAVFKTAQWMFGPGGIGLNEVDANVVTFTPYPNPTSGLVDLRLDDTNVRTIEVFDAAGQIVRTRSLRAGDVATGTLDLTGLSSGVYQVRVTQADGRRGAQRVVVQ